jgi:hypothetical protein
MDQEAIMAESKCINVGRDEELERDLFEIGTIALSIKELAGDCIQGGDVGAYAFAVGALAEKAGYLADRNLKQLGSVGVYASIDEWISPRRVADEGEHHG